MQSVNHYVGLDGIHSKAQAIWQEKALCVFVSHCKQQFMKKYINLSVSCVSSLQHKW